MSKDEFLKIQTCVLKVNIHCDGCKHKVKKILQKIEGVYTTKIDAEQGKVTVSGNIDANTLIKKLIKNGKHAEIWGAKSNNNSQNHLNQFKNLQISNGGKGGGGNNKGQGQKGGGNHPQKGGGGGGGPQGQNPHLQQIQQQMKGFQDMKMLPQFMKDMKLPSNNGKDQKAVKFKLPEDDDLSDDDYDDDDYDDDEFDDDDLDDDMDDVPLNKMKPMVGNGHGGSQMQNMMMQNMMNGQLPQHLKPGGNGGNNGGNGKKDGGGGGGNVPVHINHGGGGGGSGKKGGNGGGNPNQGGGAKGGKNGGGGGGQNKNGGGPANGNPFMANGAKKGNDGPHGMPNMMMSNGGNMGQHMGNLPQMGHMSNLPMGQLSNLAAVQGLPASSMAGGGPGYGGGGADHMQGNPYYQQQLAAMMMNQQRANGNERFQPMMYARPPPAVNYMPPYPPYPYPPPPGERADQYSMFSDENTSSCSVM